MVDSGDNTIGGTASGAGNVISNNGAGGIFGTSEIFGANLIQGNRIGTDITGTVAMGNGGAGIDMIDEASNTIGGTTAAAANVISANAGDAIAFGDVFASGNLVEGNFIGTDITGTKDFGNGGDGVDVQVSSNTVGGTVRGAGNVIAYNGGAGVAVIDGFNGPTTGVAILSNSIYANQNLGINFNNQGVVPNHPGGPIPGPNNYQNFPVLTSAVSSGGKIAIVGTLNSAASTSYLIQFFANVTPDPSGYGQGQTYLGQITVTTDANGNASFTAKFSVSGSAGQFISATATDPNGDTSEFAQDVTVTSSTSAGVSAATVMGPVASPRSIAPIAGPSVAAKASPAIKAGAVSDSVLEDLARELDRRPETADGRPRCDEESPSDDLMSQRYEFGRSVCVPTLECRPRPILHAVPQSDSTEREHGFLNEASGHRSTSGAWQEPRLLQGCPGGCIRGVAACCRSATHLVTDPLQLLDQVTAVPPLAERFADLHENVAVRRVVVKGDAAGRDQGAVVFDQPIAHAFDLVLEDPFLVGGRDVANRGAGHGEARGQGVVKQDPVARNLGCAVVEHEREEDVVALGFDAPRPAHLDQLPEYR